MDDLGSLDPHWLWIALGLAFGVLELLIPGIYLLWFAVAALVTGALTWLFGLSPALQVIDFVSLSLIAAFSARRFLGANRVASADPMLNQRTSQLVGQIARVSHAIEDGEGRIHLGDSDWIARGPDCAIGTRVRVTGSQGSVLLVKPLATGSETPPLPAEG